MVSLTRLINWVALIGGSLLFFLLQGEVNIIQRVAGATILLALASLLIFTGRERLEIPSNDEKIETEEEAKTLPESPDQINIEVVKPKSEMRRTRGMSKFPVNMPAPPPLPVMIPLPSLPAQPPAISALQSPPIPDTQDVISTLPEGINVAKKYIAKGDAISDEEEEIEGYIAQRRQKREKMLSDIERRRRMKLAERKASMARKWSEAEDGEDLASILREEDHGLTVYEEPESPNTGKPLGITYFRIDENRILMMRKPLEVINKISQERTSEANLKSELSTPPQMPHPGMPPLPPPGMPPLPPPNFGDTE
tara:strand:+ start:8328 stop:9257 length:930 start_codon:yes stop_codon:yes gene_type:complete